jgi:hypothetical protein
MSFPLVDFPTLQPTTVIKHTQHKQQTCPVQLPSPIYNTWMDVPTRVHMSNAQNHRQRFRCICSVHMCSAGLGVWPQHPAANHDFTETTRVGVTTASVRTVCLSGSITQPRPAKAKPSAVPRPTTSAQQGRPPLLGSTTHSGLCTAHWIRHRGC